MASYVFKKVFPSEKINRIKKLKSHQQEIFGSLIYCVKLD